MNREAFHLLMREYRHSKKKTEDHFHAKWQPIMDEYGLATFDQVVDWIVDRVAEADLYLTHDATVGKLHLVVRKMMTLNSMRNPQFSIRNSKPSDEAIAELLDEVFPHEMRRVNWSHKMRWRDLWAILTGFGCIKVGVNSVYHYDESAYTGELPRGLPNREQFAAFPYGPTTEYQDVSVQPGEANIIHIPSTNVFSHPWNAPNLESVIRWYVRFRRPLIDIYRDVRLKPSARAQVKPIKSEDPSEDPYFNNLTDEAMSHSAFGEEVWVYDVASRKWCIISDGVDEELKDWTSLHPGIQSPLHFFVPIESPKTWRGIPYALRVINQARAINQMRALLKEKIGRDGKTIYLFDPLSLDPETQVTKLNNLKDGEFFPIPGLSEALAQGKDFIKAIEFGKPAPEMLQLMTMFENDFREMSGLDNPAINMPNSKTLTATETHLRSQQTNMDIQDYVAANEESQEEVAADYLRVVLATWPDEKMVKVVGQNEYTYFWVPVKRSEVLSDFTLEVVAGSTQKLDKTTYTHQWIETLSRISDLAARKQQDLQYELQGFPSSGIDWDEAIKFTLDLFDPTLSKRILSKRDPLQLLYRLMKDNGLIPTNVSPQLVQEIQKRLAIKAQQDMMQSMNMTMPMGMGGAGASNVVPFEQRTRTPSSAAPNPASGMPYQANSSFAPMRANSQAMRI